MEQIGIQSGFIFPISTWYGVVLEGDKVVSINLADNNLTGEIPSEIVNLTDLRELNLQKRISGIIPSALENLKQLVVWICHLIN
jgi:hypothetical protein